ncbi:cysteine dioxygenase type I [Nocardioides albertanoniae]|uniref:Cysteine dioxygenase type I n=1 Tax=Nocardioides albertanoniae TaxID=1175486 RepID=A0A543A3M9_9ACTN|nr:cysteine dioxygenase family protein [Nocardioides albertanoniae]TQL67198.1 cysteine dioxygenase type I [Nocardioides albertanoniae]
MTTLAAQPLLDAIRTYADDELLAQTQVPESGRDFHLVHRDDEVEVWLIAWAPGTSTGFHDHGSAAAAFTVLEGSLIEHNWFGGLQIADIGPGDARVHAPGHVHDVRNVGSLPAISLHAYTPHLDAMHSYRFLGDRISLIGAEPGRS